MVKNKRLTLKQYLVYFCVPHVDYFCFYGLYFPTFGQKTEIYIENQ